MFVSVISIPVTSSKEYLGVDLRRYSHNGHIMIHKFEC